jgi:dTDP-4-dehydrorhamnose 3,5-epimerase
MIFNEVKIFQPSSFEDYRGELYTLFNQDEHELIFNHDKIAVSRQHVLRGLHGDDKAWKLITCVAGEIYLVVVDNRPESSNYLKWDSIILTAKNRKQILVPPMFANGHLVLSKLATFFYKWAYPGEYPDVKDQFSLKWNDPKINISWPIDNPILSNRDK